MTKFITIKQILAIHEKQIARFGGMSGIRDMGLLESALAMPQATFFGQYLHKDIDEMAAAYLFHLVNNHPFLDGNKRTGAVAALIFLKVNGYPYKCYRPRMESMVLAVAQGVMDKAQIAEFFRKHRSEEET